MDTNGYNEQAEVILSWYSTKSSPGVDSLAIFMNGLADGVYCGGPVLVVSPEELTVKLKEMRST